MTDETPTLRDRTTVLLRTLTHGALVLRGLMENIIATHTDEIDVGRSQTRSIILNRWMQTQGLAEHRTDVEETLLEKEPGDWSPEEMNTVVWRVEAQGVLVWCIDHLNDIPPADERFNAGAVIDALPNMAPIESFLRFTTLRPSDDLLWARDIAELWHWRARIERARRAGVAPPHGMTFEARIDNVTTGAFEHGAIPQPIDGDFPVYGQAYATIDDSQLNQLQLIAYHRHWGLNWVCGYGATEGWEETPTDT